MNPLDKFYFNWAQISLLCNQGLSSVEALKYIRSTGDPKLDMIFTNIKKSFATGNFDTSLQYLDEKIKTHPELIIARFFVILSLEMYTGSFLQMERATMVYLIVKSVQKKGEVTPQMKGYLQTALSTENKHPIWTFLESVHRDLKQINNSNHFEEATEKQVFPLYESYKVPVKLKKCLKELEVATGLSDIIESTALELGWYEKLLSE